MSDGSEAAVENDSSAGGTDESDSSDNKSGGFFDGVAATKGPLGPTRSTWRKHYADYQAALNELGEAIYEDAPYLRGNDASKHLLNGWRWCEDHDVPQPMFKDAADKHQTLERAGMEVYRDTEESDD